MGKFEVLKLLIRVIDVAAAAEVFILAGFEKGELLAGGGKLRDEFELVRVVGKGFFGLGGGKLAHFKAGPGWEKLAHFGLDLGEVFFSNFGVAEVEVVIEAVFDGGADGSLGVGVEVHDGGGQKMGSRVTEVIKVVVHDDIVNKRPPVR